MSDDNIQTAEQTTPNYESLYLQAQQEIAQHQHTIRVLAQQINEMQSDNSVAVDTKADKKKAN